MHRLTATDTPMVRYTRTIFPSYADYIQNIHLNDLILEKDIIIPISKLKKKQIKDAYLNAISKEMDQ